MINNLQSTSLYDIKYKIVLLGNMSVGKSSIIDRYISNSFDQKRQGTVGIDFLSKNVHYNGHMYRLLLWDTAGQQKFRSLVPAYLRDAHCAVLVYDVMNEESFKGITTWIQMFENYKRNDAIMVLVGNKTDLCMSTTGSKEERKVLPNIAYQFAKKRNMGYCEVSAKRGDGIEALFQSIVDNILVVKQHQKQSQKQIISSGTSGTGTDVPASSDRLGLRQRDSQSRINKKTVVSVAEVKKLNKLSCCSI